MKKNIEVIYENGVFKPLQKIDIDIKEHERVEIRILSKDEWQRRFNNLIEKIDKQTVQYSTEEIETDIAQAIEEVRKEKGGC